ncbi:hypothetical protein L873DRAFT_1816637 [Choiromyces venosus 120613-1]|uniref:Uncharacterized protein n=1 Tax=Choiromyces venosus 120613-1 TaxID=1336337 RepID=A0A3N4J411_9PEZI|nr:hypothetical protein L873DRAFT_1816637 [Choiromyces venosus 120613-1]
MSSSTFFLLPLTHCAPHTDLANIATFLHPGNGRSAHLAQPGHDLLVSNGQSADLG